MPRLRVLAAEIAIGFNLFAPLQKKSKVLKRIIRKRGAVVVRPSSILNQRMGSTTLLVKCKAICL